MSEAQPTQLPPYDENRGAFLLLAAIGSGFFGVGADSMMKTDLIRMAIRAVVGLTFFLLAFNWHRIAPRLPQKSAHFVGSAALDTRLWAVLTIAVFCYVSYPMIYSKIWSSFIDPRQHGTPFAAIQFNDGNSVFEVLRSTNINVFVDDLLTQRIDPGDCDKKDQTSYGAGTNSILTLKLPCTPATTQDDIKTVIYLSSQNEFKLGSVNVNSHGGKIPKYKVSLSGRQAIIVFDNQIRNVVLDISLEGAK